MRSIMLTADKLKEIIESRNEVKSKVEVYQKNATWETFQLAMRLLNPQSYGAHFERRIRNAYGWNKNKAKDRNGDASYCVDNVIINTEIKISLTTDIDKTVNVVQIRPSHVMDYYDIFVIAQDSTVDHYRLSKKEMSYELAVTGHKLAHGTIDGNDSSYDNAEYRIDFTSEPGNDVYDRWQQYLVDDTATLTEYLPLQLAA